MIGKIICYTVLLSDSGKNKMLCYVMLQVIT